VAECKYRGRVIGELVEGPDGFLRYLSDKPDLITDAHIVRVMSRFLRPVKLAKWPVECKWNPNVQFKADL
jgi:hypothetical protein